MTRRRRYIQILLLLCGTVATLGACQQEHPEGPMDDGAMVYLLLEAAGAGINEDLTTWEDRVDEVRMIAASRGGAVVYNDLLSFPNGMGERCAPVRIAPGVYDFFFVANETAAGTDLSAALAATTNTSQFSVDSRFGRILAEPDFRPDGTTTGGRFVMSARYNTVRVEAGGTEENPKPLVLSTDRVELVRARSKVEVVFRKKEPGSHLTTGFIEEVQLENVARYLSVPPLDDYYTAGNEATEAVTPTDFDYDNDSIGSLTWYIPEQLNASGGDATTRLRINNQSFALTTGGDWAGLRAQRRDTPSLSNYSVVRNYHYRVNAYLLPQGGIELDVCVEPWLREEYKYMFQDEGNTIVIPPVTPTDSSLIVPTDCGKVEILSTNETLSQGLMGAYGDQINWWDPVLQGPTVVKGKPPYYCEKKYGPGWRLISACELMSFLKMFDQAYRVWQSNTWQGVNSGLKFNSLPFRQEAQELLGKLTGQDMSKYTLSDNGKDDIGGEKLGMLDRYFTPGDILVVESDYPNEWPFYGPANNSGQKWYPMEVAIQIKGYWYADYLNVNEEGNYDKILYREFDRFDYSSTTSRCVRSVE
ncbi:MAG: hypothetical protein LBN24_06210 [Mediterranea sp.]|jgi:hypothetical protein|nr:hypothetical protein [Mediterranea sp.]